MDRVRSFDSLETLHKVRCGQGVGLQYMCATYAEALVVLCALVGAYGLYQA